MMLRVADAGRQSFADAAAATAAASRVRKDPPSNADSSSISGMLARQGDEGDQGEQGKGERERDVCDWGMATGCGAG